MHSRLLLSCVTKGHAPTATRGVLLTAVLLLQLAGGGCSVGRDYTPPPAQALPAHYLEVEAAGTASLISTWQALLEDPVLQQLQQHALADSPDLEIALARLGQARAWQVQQDAATGPSLNANLQVSADNLSKNGELFANAPPQQAMKTQFINSQAGFDASWELDLFGYQRRLTEAASARTDAALERSRDARLSLSAEVARNYLELRLGQQRLRLAQEQLQQIDAQLAMYAVAVRVGELAPVELLRTQTQRDNYAATLPALALAIRQNLGALSPLSGMPMADLQHLLEPPADLPQMPPAPAAGLPADLLQHRPDVRAAEREWAAASADLGVATANQYPHFSLVGNGGWQSVHDNDLLSQASQFWSLGPRVSLPLFDGGRLASQVKANAAALDIARAGYRKALLTALADVDTALSRLARDESRRLQLAQATRQQQGILTATQAQWQAGAVSRLNLLQAERDLNTQQDQLAQAQGQSLTALVALYKALGGAWVTSANGLL